MWFQRSKCLHVLIALGFLYGFCDCSILIEKGFPTFWQTVFCRAGIPISNKYSCYYKKRLNIYQVFLLFECFQMLWLQLLFDMKNIVMYPVEALLILSRLP